MLKRKNHRNINKIKEMIMADAERIVEARSIMDGELELDLNILSKLDKLGSKVHGMKKLDEHTLRNLELYKDRIRLYKPDFSNVLNNETTLAIIIQSLTRDLGIPDNVLVESGSSVIIDGKSIRDPIEMVNVETGIIILFEGAILVDKLFDEMIADPSKRIEYDLCKALLSEYLQTFTVPNDIEDVRLLHSIMYSEFDPLFYYNQQVIENCGVITFSNLIMKIIQMLYFCKTKGKILGGILLDNTSCLQHIFTMNNIFIIQQFNYERQLLYLWYLSEKYFSKCKEKHHDLTLELFFYYIYINFYLFMFIVSYIDDYLKINDSRPACGLNPFNVCIFDEEITKRGLVVDYLHFLMKEYVSYLLIHLKVNL
jgi:hypothetical protein